jgi:hypothetical protein
MGRRPSSCTVGGTRQFDGTDPNDLFDPSDLLDPLDPHDPIDLVTLVTATSDQAPAFSYRIDRETSLVFLIYGTRQPTFDEWRAAMDSLLDDPLFHAGMPIVSDRRRLVEAPTTAMLQKMAAYEYEHRDLFGDCRWAVVTGPEARAEFGMARMSQAMLEGGRSRITLRPFTDIDEAIGWATTGEEPAE